MISRGLVNRGLYRAFCTTAAKATGAAAAPTAAAAASTTKAASATTTKVAGGARSGPGLFARMRSFTGGFTLASALGFYLIFVQLQGMTDEVRAAVHDVAVRQARLEDKVLFMSFTYVFENIVSPESEEDLQWLTVPEGSPCNTDPSTGLLVYCGGCDQCRRSEAFDVAVRDAGGKGSGLFATKSIRKGKIVAFYAGELLSTREATRRVREASVADLPDNYLLSVCEHFQGPLKAVWTHVDARYFGSLGRFANHRCGGGNTEPCVTRRPGGLPMVVLMSLRDIALGEEITFDYGGGTAVPDGERKRKCLCGSPSCIGMMPFHGIEI
ncbi:hypothetical protein FOZ61_002521 [Perkinsus olseni]|uniref:Uncharacterized protein n=1 Tax=Perkinsus olseni TaxID=32597 RepID=A0A7J6LT19_PEROL|nr:hypothetical protein FOZ61_002521 [Perkinsus olseni]